MDHILKLTTGEIIALDRILSQIKYAVKDKKKSTSISLTNKHFVEMVLSIVSKRFMSEEEILKLSEEIKKL